MSVDKITPEAPSGGTEIIVEEKLTTEECRSKGSDVNLFWDTFIRGRMDAYGTPDPSEPSKGMCVKERITKPLCLKHLKGEKRIGVYFLSPDILDGSGTWFAVADIDNDDLELATTFCWNLDHLGIPCYIERSKSKGFHIWVFFSEPVEAKLARALMKYPFDIIKYEFGYDNEEIFPKQNTIRQTDGSYGLGNYIYLPLNGASVKEEKTVFLNPEGWKPYQNQGEFLSSRKRATPEVLNDLIERGEIEEEGQSSASFPKGTHPIITPSPTPKTGKTTSFPSGRQDDYADMLPCVPKMMKGVPEGCRDVVAFTLAKHFRVEKKLPQDITTVILKLWNQKNQPPLDDKTIEDKVKSAYSGHGGRGYTSFGCAETLIQQFCDHTCLVYKAQMVQTQPKAAPIPVHLTDIEKREYADKLVTTEVLLPGVGRDDSYFVPKSVEAICLKDDKTKCPDNCPLKTASSYTKDFNTNDRRLLNYIKMTDAQVYGELRKALDVCKEASISIIDRAEVQILLAMPKAGAELKKQGGKFVDEHGRDFREKVIYYTGVVPRSNTYYQVTGRVISDPRSQRATMLGHELVKLQDEYEKFEIDNTRELLKAFQPENDSLNAIDRKIKELGTDIAYNLAFYFGEPRVNIVIADMLTWHSVLQFEFDGKPLPKGWVDLLILGDSGINKTEHLRNLRNAIGFGHFVDAGAVSRAGLLYSLDDVLSGIRILRWGALPLNDGQLVIIDEAQNIQLDVWCEMSSARATGLLVVTKAKQGEHPMKTRQIYTANPKPPHTMADFSFGIRGVKDLMRPADMRRFDIVICASRNEVSMDEINLLKSQRAQKIPQRITPEHLRASIARAWTRRPEHIIWDVDAEATVMAVAKDLHRHFGTGDIPVIDVDAKDKVARLSVAVAAWLVSTDESLEKVIVKHDHVCWVGLYLSEIYSAQPAMLDRHAKVAGKMEKTTDSELDHILQGWETLNPPEPEHLKEMAILIAESEGIERDVLAAHIGVEPQSISRLIQKFKEHRFVRSTKKGYFATPRMIEFYRSKLS